MTLTCPRCAVRGREHDRIEPLGVAQQDRHGRRRTVVKMRCCDCGYLWFSALAAVSRAEGLALATGVTSPGVAREPTPWVTVEDLARRYGRQVQDWRRRRAQEEG